MPLLPPVGPVSEIPQGEAPGEVDGHEEDERAPGDGGIPHARPIPTAAAAGMRAAATATPTSETGRSVEIPNAPAAPSTQPDDDRQEARRRAATYLCDSRNVERWWDELCGLYQESESGGEQDGNCEPDRL